MRTTRTPLLIIVVVIILVAVMSIRKASEPTTTPASKASPVAEIASDEALATHGIGEGTSGVLFEEYGDFQSEASKAYQPLVQRIKEKYGDELRFQYRDFAPAENTTAKAAQQAADAADLQGSFWEMHAMLYDRQAIWKDNSDPSSIFEGFAKELGLDIEEFRRDYRSTAVQNTIKADRQAGLDAKVVAAPTFFINGVPVAADTDFEGFVALIEAAKRSEG